MSVQFADLVGPLYQEGVIQSHAAATATEEFIIFTPPKNARVRAVIITPGAAITGANTNTTHVNLISYTDAATPVGTERANKDFVSGTDGVKAKAISLYAPATYLNLDVNNRLAIQIEKVGTGLDLPSFGFRVEYDFAR